MYDYVKHIRWAKIKVGLVITIALAIVFLSVMFAGNIDRLLAPRTNVFALADDVRGLREGSPVWFSGVEIGSVKKITFTGDQKVLIEMSIMTDTMKYLKSDSRANIMTLGLLGDKYVELVPGSAESGSLQAGDMLTGTTPSEIQDVVETGKASLSNISRFVTTLETVIEKIEGGEGSMAKFINDPGVYNNLKDTTMEMAALIKKIRSGEGSVGKLVSDDRFYDDLSSSARDIKLFADSLQKSDGTLRKMIDDPALYDNFLKASSSIDVFTDRLITSKGTVSRLIDDASLYDNLNDVSERLNIILTQIEKGDGLMGELVSDKELSDDVKSTIREMKTLMQDIKDNPTRYFKFSIF